MKRNKTARTFVNAGMVILLPLLMAYSLIGENFHEIAGVTMFLLFAIHQFFNRKWYGALFKGRYSPRRIYHTAVNTALFIAMLMQPLSGIMMSKYVLKAVNAAGATEFFRTLHIVLAYWTFVLMCVHAGIHIGVIFDRAKKRSSVCYRAVLFVSSMIALYGVFAFFKRQLPEYMLMRVRYAYFDYSEPRVFFIMDYAAIMILFMMLGHVADGFFRKINKADDKECL